LFYPDFLWDMRLGTLVMEERKCVLHRVALRTCSAIPTLPGLSQKTRSGESFRIVVKPWIVRAILLATLSENPKVAHYRKV